MSPLFPFFLNAAGRVERLISAERNNRIIIFKVSIDLAELSLVNLSHDPCRDADRLAKAIGEKRKTIAALAHLVKEIDESELFFFSKKALKAKARELITRLIGSPPFLVRAYIDIDGVLLTSNGAGEPELVPDYERIMDFLQNNFDCSWLTTHVRGDSRTAVAKLKPYLDAKGLDPGLLGRINPGQWTTLKIEAIDLRLPFIWLEDDPLSAEVEALAQKGFRDSLLIVNSRRRSGRLTVARLKKARERSLRRFLLS